MRWREAAIGFQIEPIIVNGLNVWEHDWRNVNADRAKLPHPSYPKQIHDYQVWEMGPLDKPICFAACELSNGVWGFYVPDNE
jgi:hypothetical protein